MLDSLTPQVRRKFLHVVYRVCGRQALVPRSLEIPLCYDPEKDPVCFGGFSDVWKGRYRDWEVAAKVLRVRPKDDLGRIKRVSCWWYFRLVMCIDNWPCLAAFLQGGRGVEVPSPPERAAAFRRNDG